ncbi:methyltransferase [Streptomyces sp. NBC_01023]|uniref:methyltransferase n=1 Tax=unclassified Streptomyces TaxID=2593676 RepID=UPI00324BA9E5|nr:methyltransferase [Streptomyces sp. NBC_01023]
MGYTRADWSEHYKDGRGFRPLRDVERDLLIRHAPAPDGGRALEVGCGTGELAAHLTQLGYAVDALDFAEGALARARQTHEHVEGVRWLCLDIEHDDLADLDGEGYDLVIMRLVYAFLGDRTSAVRALAARLRPGGALVVITPVAASTPGERRYIALDEDEIGLLSEGWEQVERCDAEGLAFVILRGPGSDEAPLRSSPPAGVQSRPSGTGSPWAAGAAGATSSRRHAFRLLGRHYAQVESGRKTIEVRVRTPTKAAVEVGDTVVFHDQDSGRELDIIVKRVTPYASFDDLLSAEDPARIDPDGPREELLTSLRTNFPVAEEYLGTLAFEFDHRPAQPGRPMPMTPSQYAQTIPHHTVYGCLYVRDEHDRPVQLRSVYGSRLWQFPGGNLDAQGEDPLQTARRETVEETGLELGLGTPRLLLTHFLHAGGPRMPLNKMGLVFDGGRLSADQLHRIRLDPAEHDMWAIHDLAGWRELMAPRAFARLDAVERARLGEGPAYLITHT